MVVVIGGGTSFALYCDRRFRLGIGFLVVKGMKRFFSFLLRELGQEKKPL